MAIFNNYVKLPDGESNWIPLNHHFPMVFLRFSYGFPVYTIEFSPCSIFPPKGPHCFETHGAAHRAALRAGVFHRRYRAGRTTWEAAKTMRRPSENRRVHGIYGYVYYIMIYDILIIDIDMYVPIVWYFMGFIGVEWLTVNMFEDHPSEKTA